MKKKYLIVGGNVQSKSDGDIHYISPIRLCQLYKINPDECVLMDYPNDLRLNSWLNLKELHPRYDGNYVLEGG